MPQNKISIHLNSVPFNQLLDSLTQQTGYMFSYSSDVINGNTLVSVNTDTDNINALFNDILPDNIIHKIHGNHIIFYANNQEEAPDLPLPIKNIEENISEYKRNTPVVEKISFQHSGITVPKCHSDENYKNIIEMKKQHDITLNSNDTVASPSSEKPNPINWIRNNLTSLLIGVSALMATDTIMAQTDAASANEKPVLISSSGTKRPFQFSFVYPLGTDGMQSAKNTYNFSFNVLGGVTGAIEGIEMASLFNVNSFGSKGFQLAGLLNLSGIPTAEIMESENVQIAGLVNITRKGFSAAQIGGIANLADNTGAQIAGIAGFSNKSNVQISGVINAAHEANLQIATINVAKQVNSQIGVVNVSSKTGFQLGVVNIADTADFQIGIVNLSKNGIMEIELGYNSFWESTASFRSGKEYFYSIISVGYNNEHEFRMSGGGLGFGIPFGNKLGMNIEAVSYQMQKKGEDKYNGVVLIKPLLRYKFNRLQIFAGPNMNMSISNTDQFKSFLPSNLFFDRGKKINGWIGYDFGIRYSLL